MLCRIYKHISAGYKNKCFILFLSPEGFFDFSPDRNISRFKNWPQALLSVSKDRAPSCWAQGLGGSRKGRRGMQVLGVLAAQGMQRGWLGEDLPSG